MKTRKRKPKSTKKQMAAIRLQNEAVKFIEVNGGKVIVIGEIGVMKESGSGLYNYHLTIKVTGRPPEQAQKTPTGSPQ